MQHLLENYQQLYIIKNMIIKDKIDLLINDQIPKLLRFIDQFNLDQLKFITTLQDSILSKLSELEPEMQLLCKVCSGVENIIIEEILCNIYPVAEDINTLTENLERLLYLNILNINIML